MTGPEAAKIPELLAFLAADEHGGVEVEDAAFDDPEPEIRRRAVCFFVHLPVDDERPLVSALRDLVRRGGIADSPTRESSNWRWRTQGVYPTCWRGSGKASAWLPSKGPTA